MLGDAPAHASTRPDVSTPEQAYVIELKEPGRGSAPVEKLLKAADLVEGKLHRLRFEGEEGVGEVVVADGIDPEHLSRQAVDLFNQVNADVPPIVAAIVLSDGSLDDRVLTAAGVNAAVRPVAIDEHLQSALADHAIVSDDSSEAGNAQDAVGLNAATTTVVNDWSAYFPADWRAEGYNMNRCTNYSGGVCHSSIQAARLTQNVRWMDDHNPGLWPSNRFGLEFGVALKNYSFCDENPGYTPGYWLNPDYDEWATGVPASAVPYLDTNRLSDACENLSHELGVRYPGGLYAGATYGFTLTTKRNVYTSSSTYDASFQAVYDNCTDLGLGASTDCMGLTNPSFPWGQRSATVVNTTRYFSFPKCARMHDKWNAPVQWSNGGSILMPAPLSYYDTCFSNSW